ncbi:hypothetical protein Trco_000504 [Trichoderma cornu-damae]|uniref:Uncharacterized protein n=1 Tax=Trichoderma cornu-damae TaxID=654480 RepID=A0A9P8QSH8_9HYPO|nr:hypothetical protein Trco_000504 [Trichoderma cornu-damae]
MCFSVEPKAKYYYHEEIIPSRPYRGHHHHHHHSPRASYTTVERYSPRVSASSYRRSGPTRVVYEETTRSRY